MENKAQKVDELMKYCLYTKEEAESFADKSKAPDDALFGDGLVTQYAFHPERIGEKKGEIKEILADMQDPFFIEKGGGWTFLNMAEDRHGQQWGEHRDCGNLCALGGAAGLVTFPLPRDVWNILPGGVPYVAIDLR